MSKTWWKALLVSPVLFGGTLAAWESALGSEILIITELEQQPVAEISVAAIQDNDAENAEDEISQLSTKPSPGASPTSFSRSDADTELSGIRDG